MPLHQINISDPADKTETAMGIAMRSSGANLLLPGERLAALARDACLTHARKAAQRRHISDALRDELTFALIEHYEAAALGRAIGMLLEREQAKIDAEQPHGPPQRAAASATAPAERIEGQEDQDPPQPIELNMPTPVVSWDRDGRFANDEARAAKAANALARTAVRLSKLDDFYINGRKIGDVTPDEADSFAASRERDARFIRLLTAGLPRGLSKPIREYRTAEESDTLFVQAEKARLKH